MATFAVGISVPSRHRHGHWSAFARARTSGRVSTRSAITSIDRLVQVAVGGRDADLGVQGQDPQLGVVLEPAQQHQQRLHPDRGGPLHRTSPVPATIGDRPPCHDLQGGRGHTAPRPGPRLIPRSSSSSSRRGTEREKLAATGKYQALASAQMRSVDSSLQAVSSPVFFRDALQPIFHRHPIRRNGRVRPVVSRCPPLRAVAANRLSGHVLVTELHTATRADLPGRRFAIKPPWRNFRTVSAHSANVQNLVVH